MSISAGSLDGLLNQTFPVADTNGVVVTSVTATGTTLDASLVSVSLTTTGVPLQVSGASFRVVAVGDTDDTITVGVYSGDTPIYQTTFYVVAFSANALLVAEGPGFGHNLADAELLGVPYTTFNSSLGVLSTGPLAAETPLTFTATGSFTLSGGSLTETYTAPTTLPSVTQTIVTTGGNVAIDTPTGETFFATASQVVWTAGAGQSTFVGGSFSATVAGARAGSGLTVYGAAGALTFDGGSGSAVIVGGTGTLSYAGSTGSDTIFAGAAQSVDVVGAQAQLTFVGGAAAASVTAGPGSAIYLSAAGGTAMATGSNVTLAAPTGNASLAAAASGGDLLVGGASTSIDGGASGSGNVIFGGQLVVLGTGADTVVTTGAPALIVGGSGNLIAYDGGATVFELTVDGNAHHDQIIGFQQGSDHLTVAGAAATAQGYAGVTVITAGNTEIDVFGVDTNSVASLS